MKMKREDLINEIDKLLADNQLASLSARVLQVHRNIIILDIGRLGIPGFIPLKEWSVAYTQTLKHTVKHGDIIQIAVIEEAHLDSMFRRQFFKGIESKVYVCSRKRQLLDPWKNVNIEKGDIIKVECTAKKKDFFTGRMEGIPDIEIILHLSTNNGVTIRWGDIMEKHIYSAYVVTINKEKYRITAKAFKEVRITGNG